MEHLIPRGEVTFEEKDYSQYIKNRCAGCGRLIRNDWKNYQVRGNYCTDCSNKATLYVELDARPTDEKKQKLRSMYHEEYLPLEERMGRVKYLIRKALNL